MKPLWNTWRCRRNANFFMFSLAGFFGLLIVMATIHHNDLDQYVAPVLTALGLFVTVWTGQAIRLIAGIPKRAFATFPVVA